MNFQIFIQKYSLYINIIDYNNKANVNHINNKQFFNERSQRKVDLKGSVKFIQCQIKKQQQHQFISNFRKEWICRQYNNKVQLCDFNVFSWIRKNSHQYFRRIDIKLQ
ncbi:hypothetical protein PPERSA_06736 [Pseudocohnilembus persalinus]|uniref:Uncharacterized protein n=1 Tax=Pseudocohnilembus persalinus TaxID=266149 RepID=A0A0V0QRZ7_PSEPJ|nr:hypothetical protein PPERSA_06736 [Pseudocohnilembus persalinus]|eukprot:KRX05102.1 hypothetical protein PPERSA_06736 [Pseudocohnilembus persalinus]